MSGRGDNNKHGSSGRGASNQSNQPFDGDGQDQPASSEHKQPTGGERSVDQDKSVDPSADRNQAHLSKPPKKKQ